jgi:hypothetical protein
MRNIIHFYNLANQAIDRAAGVDGSDGYLHSHQTSLGRSFLPLSVSEVWRSSWGRRYTCSQIQETVIMIWLLENAPWKMELEKQAVFRNRKYSSIEHHHSGVMMSPWIQVLSPKEISGCCDICSRFLSSWFHLFVGVQTKGILTLTTRFKKVKYSHNFFKEVEKCRRNIPRKCVFDITDLRSHHSKVKGTKHNRHPK